MNHSKLAAAALTLFLVTSSPAALLPEQIAIITRKDSDESKAVGAYYAKQRSVPTNQILELPLPDAEVLPRAEWDTNIRPQVRKWLRDNKLTSKIKCFVTVWGVPLKIDAVADDVDSKRRIAYLTAERNARLNQLNRILRQFSQLATTETPAAVEPVKGDVTLEILRQRFQDVFTTTQKRIEVITDEPKKMAAAAELQSLFLATVGMNAFAQSLANRPPTANANNPNAQSQLDLTRGRLVGIQESRAIIDSLAPGVDRDIEIMALIDKTDGVTGIILWLNSQIEALQKNESHASFDSELSAVAWSDYAINRWQPNYLNVRFRDTAVAALKPTYMVARIDAPTLKLAKQIIDTSIKIEQQGLKGKAYFDGRGLAKADEQVQPGSHPDYDRSVVQSSNIVKEHGTLEVVLNTNSDLFQAGECPNAAIYCGWYSLANYIDAFDWAEGAVAYHIASSEADTLHKPESNVWCKRMLEDGVCATMGPVYEPYVVAFPRPEQFFLLLLSGKYTLAECYWMSAPFNSWTMTLIGDPLYNPFKNAPGLKMETLPNAVRVYLEG